MSVKHLIATAVICLCAWNVRAAVRFAVDGADVPTIVVADGFCPFVTKAAEKVSRAFDLYFAAYETEFSRDRVSAYGSPRERAPLAILNDGDLQQRLMSLLRRVTHPRKPQPVCSPYAVDPDELREVASSRHYGINQDMFPNLADELRSASRARAQAASFQRCLDQLEVAKRQVPEKFHQRLFERIGYPAAFMRTTSDCCSELALAASAREEGNASAARRHLESALIHARERDALDRRYNVGKWTHWYDRNIIYPYPKVTPGIEAAIRENEKKDGGLGWGER